MTGNAHGSADISGGGTLEFAQNVVQNIDFGAGGGTLRLLDPTAFDAHGSGSIAGFAASVGAAGDRPLYPTAPLISLGFFGLINQIPRAAQKRQGDLQGEDRGEGAKANSCSESDRTHPMAQRISHACPECQRSASGVVGQFECGSRIFRWRSFAMRPIFASWPKRLIRSRSGSMRTRCGSADTDGRSLRAFKFTLDHRSHIRPISKPKKRLKKPCRDLSVTGRIENEALHKIRRGADKACFGMVCASYASSRGTKRH